MPSNDTILNNIEKYISDVSDTYEKEIARKRKLDKKEHAKQIKEKTEAKSKLKNKNIDSNGSDKEMGTLRKTFSESFGKVNDFASPGNLMKMTGLLANSPLVMMAGEQLDQLRKSYKENKENKKVNSDALEKLKDSDKNDFLTESKDDEALKQRDRQNNLLENIATNTDELSVKKDSESGGMLGGLAGALGGLFSLKGAKGLLSFKGIGKLIATPFKFLRKSVFGMFEKIFGKTLFKGAFKGIFKKVLGKGLIKGIGKKLIGGLLRVVAEPITLIFAAFDFYKGFKNSKEITGRDGIEAKIQGGISQVISGLTFGLIDPKFISKEIDVGIKYINDLIPTLKDRFMNFLMAPIDFFKDIFSGKKGIVESYSDYLSKMSFGLIDGTTFDKIINDGIAYLDTLVPIFKEKIMSFLMYPINFFKNIFTGKKGIIESWSDYLSKMSFGLIDAKSFESIITSVTDLISEPFNFIKNYLFEMFAGITMSIKQYIDDIGNTIADIKQKLLNVLSSPIDTIKNLFFGNNDTGNPKDSTTVDLKKEENALTNASKFNTPKAQKYNNATTKAIKQMSTGNNVKNINKPEQNVIQQNNSVSHTHISKDMMVFSDDHSIYNPVPVY